MAGFPSKQSYRSQSQVSTHTVRPITAHLVKIHAAALRLGVPDQAVGEGAARAGGTGVWSGPAVWWGALESSHAGANHRSVSRPITAHLVKVHTAALRLGVPDLAVGEGAARAGGTGVWSGPAVW